MWPTIFETDFAGRRIAINGYGLMVGLAVVLWGRLVAVEAARRGHPDVARRTTGTLLCLIVATFVGGKGLHLLTKIGAPEVLGGDGLHAGFVFYGAMLLAIPVMIFRARALGMRTYEGLDVFASATPLSHALGRVGCMLAGCCYGHRSDLPWAVTFEAGHGLNGVALHPAPLYEALGLVLLHIWIRFRERGRPTFDGRIFLVYLIGYSIVRGVVEFFRGDPERRILFSAETPGPGDPPAGLPTSVLIAILTGLAAFVMLRRMQARAQPPQAPGSRAA